YDHLFLPTDDGVLTAEILLEHLNEIRTILINDHNSLFLYLVDNLIAKIEVFGLYFASLDVRQESTVHGKVFEEVAEKTNALPKDYATKTEQEKQQLLFNITESVDPSALSTPLHVDTLASVKAVKI